MDEKLQSESRALEASWSRHDRRMLRDYLVQDVEDPRLNVASILTRHFLIEQLFPDRFTALQEQELRFSNAANWTLLMRKRAIGPDVMRAVLDALLLDEPEVAGIKAPGFLRQTFADLPAKVDGVTVPDYLSDMLLSPVPHPDSIALPDHVLGTFTALWSRLLAREEAMSIAVLEPACGSANDYRFLDAFGIARFCDYAGIDICDKNIANAREMFPDIYFAAGNVLQIDAPDGAFDYIISHDLFEHLSIAAMERAVAEVCRVASRGLCLGFFNMDDAADHLVQRKEDYHWNRLSMPRMKELFAAHGGEAQFIHLDTMLRQRFDYTRTHNRRAWLVMVRRSPGGC